MKPFAPQQQMQARPSEHRQQVQHSVAQQMQMQMPQGQSLSPLQLVWLQQNQTPQQPMPQQQMFQQMQQQQQPGSGSQPPQPQPQQWQQQPQQQQQQQQQPGAPQAPSLRMLPPPSALPTISNADYYYGQPQLGYGAPQPWYGSHPSMYGPPSAYGHPGPQPLFYHPMTLQGLSGAGKTCVTRAMHIRPTQLLSEDGAESKQPEANSHYNMHRGHSFGVNAYGGRCAMPIPRLIPTARAIVLVVDSCNRAVLTPPSPPPAAGTQHSSTSLVLTVKQTLARLLQQPKLVGLPLLVLANKQDKEGAMSTEEIARLLDLAAALDGVRDWRIAGCNALTGEGVAAGFQWLNVIIAAPTNFQAKTSVVPTKDILGILGPDNTSNDDSTNTTADVTAAELLAAAKDAAPKRPVIPANAVEQPTSVEGAVPRAA